MTTSVSTLLWRANDATENYNWVKAVSDALDAVGMTQHTDTGQLNLSGVTTLAIPSGLGAQSSTTHYPMGVQIRKFVSSGKNTIYMQISYGVRRSGSTSWSPVPSMVIRFSDSTNGAGTLTGNLMAGNIATGYGDYASNTPSSITRSLYVSSDGQNFLSMVLDPGLNNVSSRANSQVPIAFVVERTIDATTLAYDNTGYVYVNGASVVPSGYTYYPIAWANFAGGHTIAMTTVASVPAQAPPYYSSSASAGNSHLFPVTVAIPFIKAPMKSLLYYYNGDIADGTFINTSIYGETHQYITCGLYTQDNAQQASLGLRMAIRHD